MIQSPSFRNLVEALAGVSGPRVPLIAMLLLASPFSAHASSSGRVVVDLVQAGDAESAMTLLRNSFGEGFEAEVLTLDQLVEVGPWPWVNSPTARLAPCTAEPTTASDIEAALTKAEEMITGLDYETALTELDQLADNLCGCTDPLSPTVTHRIPYLRGIALYFNGDQDGARQSFRQAAEMTDGLEWDTSFPPEPQQVFLLGAADALQTPQSKLLPPSDDRPDQVFVDGREIESAASEVEVRGERHVVQFGPEGGSLTGVLLFLDTPGDVPLFGPDSFRGALTSTPGTEFGSHAFAIVAQIAAAQGYSEVMVLADSKWNHAWWTQADTQEWQKTSLKAGVILQRARRHRTAGGVLMGSGGALIAGGAVLAAAEFTAMSEMRPDMETHTSAYEFNIDEYDSRQSLAGVGIGLAAVGAVAVTTGIVLLSKGRTIQRETGVDPRLAVMVTPEGAWLGVGGRF